MPTHWLYHSFNSKRVVKIPSKPNRITVHVSDGTTILYDTHNSTGTGYIHFKTLDHYQIPYTKLKKNESMRFEVRQSNRLQCDVGRD